MNYSNLLNRAFNLTWNHKFFWVLGFFAASSSFTTGINDIIPKHNIDHIGDYHLHTIEQISDWIFHGPGLLIVVAAIGLLFLLGLIFFIMHLISVAGLIKGVVKVENGENPRARDLLRDGAEYFWRFLGLFFMSALVGVTFAAILVAPLVLAFIAVKAFGLLLLIVIIPVGFAGIFFLSNLYSLAQREMVIYNKKVFDAIRDGYTLFIKNLGPNLVIFLIMMALVMAIMISLVILIAIFAVPLAIIGAVNTLVLIIIVLLVLPLFLAVAIVVEGFLGTFFNSLFTYFYLELKEKMAKPTEAIEPQTDS